MNLLPLQKVSYKQKQDLDKYIRPTATYFINAANFSSQYFSELRTLIRAGDGKLILDDYEYVLNPYGTDDPKLLNMPAQLRNMDIITPVAEAFTGERSKLPNDYTVFCTNSDSKNKMLEGLAEHIDAITAQKFVNQLNAQGYPTGVESQEVPEPKQAAETYKEKWVDKRSIAGQEALDYLIHNLRTSNKFQEAYRWWLITGKVFTYKYINHNDVEYEIVPVGELSHGYTRTGYVEDAPYIVRRTSMNVSDIIDRWREILKPEDLEWLEERFNRTMDFDINVNQQFIMTENIEYNKDDYGYHPAWNRGQVYVYHIEYKTWTKTGKLLYQNKLGMQMTRDVSEDYVLDIEMGDISIEWEWEMETWEILRLHENIHVYCRPLLEQRTKINNSSVCKLNYNGKSRSTSLDTIKSLYKTGLPYQCLYNIYHYRREQTLNRNRDKLMVIPVGLIPADFAKDGKDPFDQFMYYLDSMGIVFFDETQPNAAAVMNAIKSVDMSLYNYIKGITEVLQQLKEEFWDSVGMNRQRFGDTMASDGKGVNEQAIFRSSVISAEMNRQFDDFIEVEYQGLLDLSKIAWIDGKKGTYINSDERVAILDMDSITHLESEYQVFVRRSTDKKEVVDGIKSMLAPYAQKGVYNPASLAAAMDTNNTSKIKRYLNDAYNVEKQYQQALEDSKNEAAKYSADMAAKTAQEANELKKYEADKRYEAAIDVALITAQGYLDDSETPGATGGEDTENAKIAIQNKKLDLDAIKEARAAFMDSRKQEHTEKMDKIAVEQKDRELSIKARKSTSSGK